MTSSLFVRMDKIQMDPAMQSGGRGARKLAVTQVYNHVEVLARDSNWEPPHDNRQPCPVLELPGTEVAVFNEIADQQRHFHKQATEIYVVVSGSMAVEVDGATHHLQSGDAVIIGPGRPHKIKNQGLKFTSYVISSNSGGPADKFPA